MPILNSSIPRFITVNVLVDEAADNSINGLINNRSIKNKLMIFIFKEKIEFDGEKYRAPMFE